MANTSGQGLQKSRSGTLSTTQRFTGNGVGSAKAETAARDAAKDSIAGSWTYWPVGEPSNPVYNGQKQFSGSTQVISNAPHPAQQPGDPTFWTWQCVLEVAAGATCSQTGWVAGSSD